MAQNQYCHKHTDSHNQLSLICLAKGCSSSFSLCCTLCRKQNHRQHEGRVVSLSDFYKNLNTLRIDLSKKLKMNSNEDDSQKIMSRLKVVKSIRGEMSLIEAKILDSAMGLKKLHSQYLSNQCQIISQIQYLNLNRNMEDTQSRIKELGNSLQYNFAKMKIEVVDHQNRKSRQNKEKILRETDKYYVQLKEYMIKMVDATLDLREKQESHQKNDDNESYSLDQFRQYLESNINSLQQNIKHTSNQLRNLHSKLSNIQEQFERPFVITEYYYDCSSSKQYVEIIDQNEHQEIEAQTKNTIHSDTIRSSISSISPNYPNNNYAQFGDTDIDDKSVACSMDFSRMDQEGANIKEKWSILKGRAKTLQSENQLLRKVKKQLQLQLTNANNKLSLLIKEIAQQKNLEEVQTSSSILTNKLRSSDDVINNKKILTRRLRVRSLQPVNIFPQESVYKCQFQEVLSLYNEVVSHHIQLKERSYSNQIELQSMKEEDPKLRKKISTLEKQISILKKQGIYKDKNIMNLQKNIQMMQLQINKRDQKIKQLQQQLSHDNSEHQNKLQSILSQFQELSLKAKKPEQQCQLKQVEGGLAQVELVSQQTQVDECHVLRLEQGVNTSFEDEQMIKFQQLQQKLKLVLQQKQKLSQQSTKLQNISSEKLSTISKDYMLKQESFKREISTYIIKLKESKQANIKINDQLNSLKSNKVQIQDAYKKLKQDLTDKLKHFQKKEIQHQTTQESKEKLIQQLRELLQKEKQTLKQKQQDHKKRVESHQTIFSQHNLEIKLLLVQKQSIQGRFAQTVSQISKIKLQLKEKDEAMNRLAQKTTELQKQKKIWKEEEEANALRNQALLVQNKNYQTAISEQKSINKRLSRYIGELQDKIKSVQKKIQKSNKARSKWGEAELILQALKEDVIHLSDKLKDKEMIQKIYIKQLDVKKQEILRLTRQNQNFRGFSLRKEEKKGVKHEKENKLKKYLSFGGMNEHQ